MGHTMFYIYFYLLIWEKSILGQFVGINDIHAETKTENLQHCSSVDGPTDAVILDKTKWSKSLISSNKIAVPDTVYVEVFIVIDEILADEIGKSYSNGKWNKYGTNPMLPIGNPSKETELYLRKFMTAVNARFEDQFSSPKIKLHISGLYNGKHLSFYMKAKDDKNAMDVFETLYQMTFYYNESFRKKQNTDIALYLTGQHRLCKGYCKIGSLFQDQYKGASYQNGACLDIKSYSGYGGVAIVKDFGAFSGVTLAVHQIGHLLGAEEDGNNNPCCSEKGYIMTNHTTADGSLYRNNFKWSICSVKAINKFLSSPRAAECLYNKPKRTNHRLLRYQDLIGPNVPTVADQCSVMKKPSGKGLIINWAQLYKNKHLNQVYSQLKS